MKTNNNYGPILWPIDGKSGPIGKDPEAGKDWGQEERGVTEDETVGWQHWLDGREFEQGLGCGEGQGILECCSLRGHKELDMTQRLNHSKMAINDFPVKSTELSTSHTSFNPWSNTMCGHTETIMTHAILKMRLRLNSLSLAH